MTRGTPTTLLLVLVPLAAGCGGKPAAPPPSPLEQAAAAERDVRTTARVGVRPELGASADAFFADLDAARAAGLPVIPLPLLTPGGSGFTPPPVAATSPVGQSATSALAALFLLLEPGISQPAVNGSGTKHVDLPNGSADASYITTLSQSGSTLTAGIIQKVVYATKDGRTITELTTGSAQLQLCPDATGQVPITYTFHFDVATPGGGVQIDLSGTGTGQVGEDAGLQSWTSDSHVSYGAQGSALPVTGSNATVRVTRSFDWASAAQTAHDTTVVRDTTVESIATALIGTANTMPPLLERYILEKAQARWQGGACVEILVAGAADANDVTVNSTTSFTGTVHHRIDGVDLPLPISAALSGSQSVAPTAPTTSPVSYAYAAGPKDGVLSTVNLETRSRRGVGKKALAFSTKVLNAYAGTIGFSCAYVGTAPASTLRFTGSSSVRLAVSSPSGGGGIFKPDPAIGSTTFSTWSSDDGGATCTMVGTATGGPSQILGTFVLLATSTPPQYEFGMVAQANGTVRCVSKPDGKVTTASQTMLTNLNNSPAPGVLSWVPVTDPALLAGAVHFHFVDAAGVVSDCDTTWSLAPQ